MCQSEVHPRVVGTQKVPKFKNKGYNRYDELDLYDKWKELDIKALLDFLDIIWKEKDDMKPKYLGENTYNNFRGIAFEEFYFDENSIVCPKVVFYSWTMQS
ncbi:MAG: hypothetical protein ACE5OT_02450 [Candidatus Hadarchaeaceae archaeon]